MAYWTRKRNYRIARASSPNAITCGSAERRQSDPLKAEGGLFRFSAVIH